MRLTVWCPGCNKQYGVREEFRTKRLKCKNCAHVFRVEDALESAKDRNPPSLPVAREQATAPSPFQPAEVVDAQVVAPGGTGGEDLSQFFHSSANVGAPVQPSNAPYPSQPVATQQSGPSVRHKSSPWMIPAILLAIFGSLALGGVCVVARTIITIKAVADRVEQKRVEEQSQAKDFNTPVPLPNQNMERSVIAGSPNTLNGDSISTAPFGGTPTDDRADRLTAAEQFAADEKRVADATRKAMEKIEREKEAEARKAREKEREARLEKSRLAAEERKQKYDAERKAKEEKENWLTELENAAESNPEEGLIARMQVDGFGAKDMALTDSGVLFVTTSDKFLAFDCNRKREIELTNLFKSIKRFSILAISDDGSMLAVGGDRGEIELFKLNKKGKMTRVGNLKEHDISVTHLAFNQDATRLFSVDRKNKICFWNTKKDSYINKVENFGSRVIGFHIDPQTETVRFADTKNWKTYRLHDGELQQSGEFPFRLSSTANFTQDGTRVITGLGSTLRVFKLDQKDPIQNLKGHGVQWTVANRSNDKILSGADKRLYQWNLADSKLERVWSVPDLTYVQKIVLSPDHSKAAVCKGSIADDIFVFDLAK